MGSCVSRPITENQHHIPNPYTAVDGRERHKLKDFIPPATLLAQSGSTDESFFDAQPWIESDCDDEFYSTNGDYTPSPGVPRVHRRFSTGTVHTPSPLNSNAPRLMKVSSTPSRTNTPLHVNFATGTPHSNEAVPDKELADIAATMDKHKRMRLYELFRLSRGGEDFMSDKISTDTKTVSGSGSDSTPADCSSFTSATGSDCISSKRTSKASSKSRRSIRAVHPIDCLRKLRTCRHKNEKKMDAEV